MSIRVLQPENLAAWVNNLIGGQKVFGPQPAGDLHAGALPHSLDDRCDRGRIRDATVTCAVEIDDVEHRCPRVDEARGGVGRVRRVHGLRREVAAHQPDDASGADVDGWEQRERPV